MNIHRVSNIRVAYFSRTNGNSVCLEIQSEGGSSFDLTVFGNAALLTRLVDVFGDEETRDWGELPAEAQS